MMSRNIQAAEMLKQRVDERAREKKYIRNGAELLFVGNNSQGFLPSLLVSSEHNSFLFNCGEGFQRYCYTNKVKMLNIDHIFITNPQWDRVAGAYGLALTVQSIGAPKVCIHSDKGIEGFFDATKRFMIFASGIECTTDSSLKEYHDSSITIKPVLLVANSTTIQSSGNLDGTNSIVKKSRSQSNLIAYICQLPDLPGTMLPDKCRELNVPIGRHLSVLKSGQDVTLSDGRTIKSSDVCGPMNEGLKFLVLECPSESHIESVIASPTLFQVRNSRSCNGEREIGIVVHYTPQIVIENPKYREWMDGFPEKCKHLFVFHDELRRLNFVDCYRLQYVMEKLDPALFQRLFLSDELEKKIEQQLDGRPSEPVDQAGNLEDDKTISIETNHFNSEDRFIKVNSMDRFVIRPKKYSESVVDTVQVDFLYEEAKRDPLFEECLSDLRNLQTKLAKPKDYEPEVVFLGTGSSVPSKWRNTSCILINFHHSPASIIMDCGEDSYGQMLRLYGPDKLGEILKQLKMIYVSHHHTDHHIGLVELLRRRKEHTNEPVQLLLPPNVDIVLDYYNNNFDDLRATYEIHSTRNLQRSTISQNFGASSTASSEDNVAFLLTKLDGLVEDLKTIPVEHCRNACAVVMRFKIGHNDMDTFSVAYSGDARPSQEFIKQGRGCDLLIHEATFDHRLTEDALAKKHCTSSQAIGVAKAMRAKFTILTHFSQRMPKIPYFTEEFDETIGFAFDNMALRCPSDFARIPIMKDILSIVFRKSIDESDMNFYKREAKQKAIEGLLQTGAVKNSQ